MRKKEKIKVFEPNKMCIYCLNRSYSNYHVGCYRLFASGLNKVEIKYFVDSRLNEKSIRLFDLWV